MKEDPAALILSVEKIDDPIVSEQINNRYCGLMLIL